MTRILRRFHQHTVLLCAAVLLLPLGATRAQQNSSATAPQQAPTSPATQRDGQHDFDFEIGHWKTHLKRLQHPLTGSTTWIEYEGTSAVSKIWDGSANLVELEVDGPTGHIEGLSLRLYDPVAHQWSLNFANSAQGSLSAPTVGEFQNGRGEFYDQEPFNGRTIFVRNVFSQLTANSCRFEQAFSDDGGKTWEVNWIADDTRISDDAAKALALQKSTAANANASADQPTTQRNGQHDFDYEIGDWKIDLKRLMNPLTGSNTWVEFDGTVAARPIWDGRANLDEIKTDSPTTHVEGLTLRLYDPQNHQWRLYWANRKVGSLGGPPQVGEFKNGRGEFFCQDTFNGRMILLRYAWSGITANSAHFEQSFSDDGGTTWEVNWITDQTRVNNVADKTR